MGRQVKTLKKRIEQMNRHQRAAFRSGEKRVGREELQDLLAMSESEDPEKRFMAASYLCPCHVRRRVNKAWATLSDA